MRSLLVCGVLCALSGGSARALEPEPDVDASIVDAAESSTSTDAVHDPDPEGDSDRFARRTPSSECLRDPVVVRHLRRPREVARLSLTHCDGSANVDVLTELSFVARAWQTPRPTEAELAAYRAAHPERAGEWATERNRWLHPGLLVRLQAIADRWPTRDLVIVSGHRPTARRTSRHRFGRALDLQVDGVERAEVAAFAQTLASTGVGYYPNSSFTHVDVRETSVYWVDRSGPGERPDYGPWTPTEDESDAHGREVLAQVDAALGPLRVEAPSGASAASASAPIQPSREPIRPETPPAAPSPTPPRVEPRRARTDPEAERIRREAFAAIEALRRAPPPSTQVSDAVVDEAAIDWSVPF
ncbi:MAG: DUF882 domain-containing protein [Myxococcota bacterium]|jgi:hypothetical protein|nr:DUF882 domain-containing protein [Myxococcota bacterium]